MVRQDVLLSGTWREVRGKVAADLLNGSDQGGPCLTTGYVVCEAVDDPPPFLFGNDLVHAAIGEDLHITLGNGDK